MIDTSGWPNILKLVLLGTPFLLILTGILITLQIAGSRHFQVMCCAFRRSSGLEEEIRIWGTHSLRSRALIISAMSSAFTWPSIGIRRGWLDPRDVEEFPSYLRFRIKLAINCLTVGALFLLFMYAFRF